MAPTRALSKRPKTGLTRFFVCARSTREPLQELLEPRLLLEASPLGLPGALDAENYALEAVSYTHLTLPTTPYV